MNNFKNNSLSYFYCILTLSFFFNFKIRGNKKDYLSQNNRINIITFILIGESGKLHHIMIFFFSLSLTCQANKDYTPVQTN